ncbi:putative P4 [Maize umbra-like virus 1]|nr:putative P4 [Maize umbra-like virus 1]
MAITTQRGIRIRKRVVRTRRRTAPCVMRPPRNMWRESGLVLAPLSVKKVKTMTTMETFLPNDFQLSKEAIYVTWPVNVTSFPNLLSGVTNATHWRITRATVGMEPALSTSTQIVGLANADGAYSYGTGYGEVFKRLRVCNYSWRSPVGGNVSVSWPITMDFIENDDAHKSSLRTVQFLLAVTNPGVISTQSQKHTAWAEMQLELECIVKAT